MHKQTTGVVNCQDEYEGPLTSYKKHDIEQLYIPTVDHFEPTYEQLCDSVEFIERIKSEGNGVYIHCKSGVGRSAAVAYCWLLKEVRTHVENYLIFSSYTHSDAACLS